MATVCSCKPCLPLLLDVDTGVDDAMALLLALRCPDAEVLAVTCVAGNVGVDQVVDNTLRVLDAAEAPAGLPVARGFAHPLIEPLHPCPEIHGQDGIGDLQPPLPASTRKAVPEHAVQLISRTLRCAASPVTVIALGPLTNIAVAIRTEPELWREKVSRVVWMGGAVAIGGNATSWSEANARADPEAAHIVLTSGLPLLMYPWDVFLKVGYSATDLSALGVADVDAGEADNGRPSWSMLAGRLLYREMHHFKIPESMIGDAGAVAAALLPEALTIKRLHVAMELAGSTTRGMTVCDLRTFVDAPDEAMKERNVDVVMDVKVHDIKAYFSRWAFGDAELLPNEDKPAKRRRE